MSNYWTFDTVSFFAGYFIALIMCFLSMLVSSWYAGRKPRKYIFRRDFMKSKDKADVIFSLLKNISSSECGGGCLTATPASLEVTQNFKPIADLKPGDKLRYKGGLPLKFPKKGEEVFVYETKLPAFPPQEKSKSIEREDFSYLLVFSDGDTREFSGDSRYFEHV